MKRYIIYLLLSLVTLSGYAQMEGGSPGGMPPGGMNGGPGMKPGMGAPDGKRKDNQKAPKKQKKSKKKKVSEEYVISKTAGHVYVYGCSFAFGDSVLYLTTIQNIDSIALAKKTKFLPFYSDFSLQLKNKLESPVFNLKKQTCSTFFSDKRAKLVKKLTKMKKRFLKRGEMRIVQLSDEQFRFVHPLDYYNSTPSK